MATNREGWEAVITAVNGAKETLAKIREDYAEMKRLVEEFMEKPEDAERREAALSALQGFAQDLAGVDSEWPVVPPPPPEE